MNECTTKQLICKMLENNADGKYTHDISILLYDFLLSNLKSNKKFTSALLQYMKSNNIDEIGTKDKNGMWSKYCNYPHFCRQSIRKLMTVKAVGDLAGNRKLTVLDIGGGAGYIAFLFQLFGHNVLTLDIPYEDQHIFTMTTRALNIRKIEHRIQAFCPLPRFDVKFNYIIAMDTCYNYYDFDLNNFSRTISWDVPEWDFFLKDLMQYCSDDAIMVFYLSFAIKYGTKYAGAFIDEKLPNYFRWILGGGGEIRERGIRIANCNKITQPLLPELIQGERHSSFSQADARKF